MITGAERSGGRVETSTDRASTPPAEEPTTTRWENGLFSDKATLLLPKGCPHANAGYVDLAGSLPASYIIPAIRFKAPMSVTCMYRCTVVTAPVLRSRIRALVTASRLAPIMVPNW